MRGLVQQTTQTTSRGERTEQAATPMQAKHADKAQTKQETHTREALYVKKGAQRGRTQYTLTQQTHTHTNRPQSDRLTTASTHYDPRHRSDNEGY